eukprot:1168795-Pyramimonas_sp.AAC.1
MQRYGTTSQPPGSSKRPKKLKHSTTTPAEVPDDDVTLAGGIRAFQPFLSAHCWASGMRSALKMFLKEDNVGRAGQEPILGRAPGRAVA